MRPKFLTEAAPAMLAALEEVLDSIADIPWCKEQVEAAIALAYEGPAND